MFKAKEFSCYIAEFTSNTLAGDWPGEDLAHAEKFKPTSPLSSLARLAALDAGTATFDTAGRVSAEMRSFASPDRAAIRSPSLAESVYSDDGDDCYGSENREGSGDEMSSPGSGSLDDFDSEDDTGSAMFDDSDADGEDAELTMGTFEGEMTNGALGSVASCSRIAEAYSQPRYPSFPNPMHSEALPWNRTAVTEVAQWDRAYPAEPISFAQPFAVGHHPLSLGLRGPGAVVGFSMPLPNPASSDPNVAIRPDNLAVFKAEQTSPPSSPILPKDNGSSTDMLKPQQESQPPTTRLARRASSMSMSINALVNSPTSLDPKCFQDSPSMFNKLGPSAEPTEQVDFTIPYHAEGDVALMSQGLKRKHGDMDDADAAVALPLSPTSENKASLGYALNVPHTVCHKRPKSAAFDAKDDHSTVQDSKSLPSTADQPSSQPVMVHAQIERPTKRLRTVLGYAGTVAATAIVLIGGLTTLPETFFQ